MQFLALLPFAMSKTDVIILYLTAIQILFKTINQIL
jgi:hypothetical protein